jgi:hypothetical protein
MLFQCLKGLCNEMNNFFEGLQSHISMSVYAPIVLKLFCCLFMEKIKDKVLACFCETLTNCENPSNYPLQTACCGIQEPANDSVNRTVSWR